MIFVLDISILGSETITLFRNVGKQRRNNAALIPEQTPHVRTQWHFGSSSKFIRKHNAVFSNYTWQQQLYSLSYWRLLCRYI